CLLTLNRVLFFAGDILMLISGTSFSWSSPVLPKLLNGTGTPFGRNISTEEGTWISSLVPLGCAVGPFIFGYMADKVGRKPTLLFLGVPFLAAHIMLAFARIVEVYYVARFIIGLAAGGTFTIMPNYAGEMADKSVRGVLGSTLSIATCIGILFSYTVGPYVSLMIFNLMLAVFPAMFLVLFFFVGEECPHYYVSSGKHELAKAALQKIRGESKRSETEKEFMEIQEKISEEEQTSVSDIVKSRGLIKAFTISTFLLIFQQFTGINLVYYYTQIIFQETGSSLAPEVCSIIIGGVQLISSFTTPFIIDRFGRKITLVISAVGMIVTEAILATYIYLNMQGVDVTSVAFIPVLTLTLFIFSYNSGFGPLPWIMLGEVFPSRVKVLASSVVSCISWIVAFLLTKYFQLFVSFGLAQSFWLFSGCSLAALLFSQFFVVETKGKSLKEIQDILNS
ncbi:hypothetical protein NQ318_017942, partial [Aromia moschata]